MINSIKRHYLKRALLDVTFNADIDIIFPEHGQKVFRKYLYRWFSHSERTFEARPAISVRQSPDGSPRRLFHICIDPYYTSWVKENPTASPTAFD